MIADSASTPGAGRIRTVDIDVVYAGPDLDRVAAATGLSADAVVAAHTGTVWQVSCCGFAPGFAYLTGGDPRLVVPRLDTPRPEVPGGAVGLAGEYSGVYPRPSPGGWNLIGQTDAVLWDLDRDPPALLRTGTTVRFRAVRERVRSGGTPRPRVQVPPAAAAERAIAVVAPGMLCLVEDLGRGGYTDMGVSPSGAADRGAAIRANRLVGNVDGAAVLELLLGGSMVRAERDVVVAVTGAPVPLVASRTEAGAAPLMDRPVPLPAGATLRMGRPTRGVRTYLAVRGGIDVPPVLGSRSTDTLSGLGPPPVTAGMRLPVGPDPETPSSPDPGGARDVDPDAGPQATATAARGGGGGDDGGITTAIDHEATGERADEKYSDTTYVDGVPGPQQHWFDPETTELLQQQVWTVGPRSNRVGVRLHGVSLPRVLDQEMHIQPVTRGAVQIPPSGEPIVFLSDCPVTGGYPVIAVLTDESVDRLAQARPGGTVRIHLH